MLELRNHEKQFAKKKKAAFKQMRLSHLNNQSPIQHVLSTYNKLTSRGFDGSVLAESLRLLKLALQARGSRPKVYKDYTISEMDQSWRMNKVADDIKFCLTNETSFTSAHSLGLISRELGALGYKNTEILDIWFDKLDKMYEERSKPAEFTQNPTFERSVFGNMKNFEPRHYIFQGFQTSNEFRDHLETLVHFETQQKAIAEDSEAANLQKQINRLAQVAEEVSQVQIDRQSAIDAVRVQYFKLQTAVHQFKFLADNDYIRLNVLELQEMLIRAEYITPDEVMYKGQEEGEDVEVEELHAKLEENLTDRMQKASQIFYDIMLNDNNELLSPQHQMLFKATKELGTPKRKVKVQETHNDLNLASLSDSLIGLAEQALSSRRDVADRDYPNAFYEKMLGIQEERDYYGSHEKMQDREIKAVEQKMAKSQYVKMEASYLSGWRTFAARSASLVPKLHVLSKSYTDVHSQMTALRALSACKQESRDIRDQILARLSKAKQSKFTQTQALIDGLQGMAHCAYNSPHTSEVLEKIYIALAKGNQVSEMSFDQKCDTLQAIGLLQHMPTNNSEILLGRLIQELDILPFESVENDLTYNQFMKLHDAYRSFIHSSNSSGLNFKNKRLLYAMQSAENSIELYPEAPFGEQQYYDPLKQRVIQGLSASLTQGDSQTAQRIFDAQKMAKVNVHMHVEPDIVTGLHGRRVDLYVLNQHEFMHDTNTADGRTAHFMRLNAQSGLSGNTAHPVAIPLDSVVSYDLHNFQMSLKPDFDLLGWIGESEAYKVQKPALVAFASFAKNVTQSNADAISAGVTDSSIESFLGQMLSFFNLKERVEYLHEPDQRIPALNDLKFQLLKLDLVYNGKLMSHHKMMLQKALPEGYDDVSQLIEQLRKGVQAELDTTSAGQDKLDSKFDFSWQGTRQTVELPSKMGSDLGKKSIAPELLGAKFLYQGEYHQYDDWKEMMEKTYSQFDLMIKPDYSHQDKQPMRQSFNPQFYKRRVPRGVFPLPNRKRAILEQNLHLDQSPVNYHDGFAKFEADPMGDMVKRELENQHDLAQLTSEVSMIANLQNIKQGLKSDYADDSILDTILVKMDFTDKLIEEHLSGVEQASQPTFLTRDPSAFRRYQESEMAKVQSPYNQYFLKEALKKGNAKDILDRIEQLRTKVTGNRKETEKELDKLNDKLDEILRSSKRGDDDNFNLSKALDQHTNITVDLESLGVLEQPKNSQGAGESIQDQDYLDRARCQAESDLIKAKIVYKLYKNIDLSQQEKSYQKAWREAISVDSCLLENQCLVPSKPSSLRVTDMLADEIYALNSIPKVHLDRMQQGHFALNDLCLELTQILDQQTVRDVELTMLESKIHQKWDLSQEFKLTRRRNKEIDFVLQEYEELAWRFAGQFTERDIQGFKDMLAVGRGEDHFDKQYIEQDEGSLVNFLEGANNYDDRISLMETWMRRKEEEVQARVNLPTPEFKKPDHLIAPEYLAKQKQARESLLANMLTKDEFGNPKTDQKTYTTLSHKELSQLTEALVVRLHLFNKEYPKFLPQVVRALLEHPNLQNADRDTLETYCTMFECDWRGDRTQSNREEFMATHPIYMHEMDQPSLKQVEQLMDSEVIRKRLRQACQPYLNEVSQLLRTLN